MQDFRVWLQEQMDQRGWTRSELARQSGIDTGTVSNVLNEVRKPGAEICRQLAVALGLPQAVVFYRAGLLTENPNDPRELDYTTLDIVKMLEPRTDAELKQFVGRCFPVLYVAEGKIVGPPAI